MQNRLPSHTLTTRQVDVPPHLSTQYLPGANWADAFEIETQRDFEDMRSLAEQTIGAMPRWARRLLWLRNFVLAPFGLKPDGLRDEGDCAGHVDIFPVLEEKKHLIVLGLDDWHLDFRIVVERHTTLGNSHIRVTTLVERHNTFGRSYIAIITPFHRLIVQSVLKNAL